MHDYWQLLRQNPDFAKLWLSQVISMAGDWFNTIALSALVSVYSGGSAFAVSLLLVARFAPALVIGPYAGVWVDRFNRKHLLILSNALRAVIVMLFLFATTPNLLWLIYVLTFAQFALSALFVPGQSAILPSLVPHDQLVRANTLDSVTWSVMLALGALLGGVFAAVFGTAAALVFDALTFVVAALLIVSIKVSGQPQRVEQSLLGGAETGSLIEGLRYAFARPATLAVLCVKGMNALLSTETLIIVVGTQLYAVGQNGQISLGLLYGAAGIGAVTGPLLLNRFHDGSTRMMRQMIAVGVVLMLLGWLVIGLSTSLLLFALAVTLRGIGGSANWTYSSIIIQKSVPDQFLGRMFALDQAIFQLLVIGNTVGLGLLLDVLPLTLVGFIGVVFAGLTLALWTLTNMRIQRHEALAIGVGD